MKRYTGSARSAWQFSDGVMKIRLSDQGFSLGRFDKSGPEAFRANGEGISENVFSGELSFGAAQLTEWYFSGIHLVYGHFNLKKDEVVYLETDRDTVVMHFTLCGHTRTGSPGFARPVEFGCNQHNLIYVNRGRARSEWAAGQGQQFFEVHLTPTFLTRYLPDQDGPFKAFLKGLLGRRCALLSACNLIITPQMLHAIHEIVHCPRQGLFKRMFIEVKVVELLMLQLEQAGRPDEQARCSLKKKDLNKIYEAKKRIVARLDRSPTLTSLARRVGTNEFTLKKGFKEVFGTTVFGFWNDLKMQQAKKLLLEQGLTVSEVAEQTGYKNPQHFSTAFKRRFGVSPGKLKNGYR